jgi:NO-binding membrane sensor protein with MHYT domain
VQAIPRGLWAIHGDLLWAAHWIAEIAVMGCEPSMRIGYEPSIGIGSIMAKGSTDIFDI